MKRKESHFLPCTSIVKLLFPTVMQEQQMFTTWQAEGKTITIWIPGLQCAGPVTNGLRPTLQRQEPWAFPYQDWTVQKKTKNSKMSHPLHHAISSVKTHGGAVEDYLPLHNWFDETKMHYPDMRHRALRHHAEGIFWAEEKFGVFIINSKGKMVPTRVLGEQHVKEDLGFIPTIKDYLDNMNTVGWMFKPGDGRKVLKEINEQKLDHVKLD
jgi:hypothetical protein